MSFDALTVSLQLIAELAPVMPQLESRDGELAKQLRRAANSVHLNLAEGRQRGGRDRGHLYRIALGSAAEVQAALDLGVAWRFLRADAIGEALALLDRLRAMLWKLTR